MTDVFAWEAREWGKETLARGIHRLLAADRRRKWRSRAYRAPPPVYAECPSCRATVRVLPSGRWARHVESPGVRGRCEAGGRMR